MADPKVPTPAKPISAVAELELTKIVNNIPSTGKGAVNLTATQDGVQADVAWRPSSNFSSSAYWQKIRQGSTTWGARASFQW